MADAKITTEQTSRTGTLDLSSLDLEELPLALFTRLPHLRSLRVSNNSVTTWPRAVSSVTGESSHALSKLEELDLHSNTIAELPFSFSLSSTSLMALDLHANKLERIPTLHLSRLTRLDLSDNILSTANGLSHCVSLVLLDLSGNELVQLPSSIGNLVALETLRLARNRLVTLPHAIGNLRVLSQLELDHNRLEDIPWSVAFQARVGRISAFDNPTLKRPPGPVVEQGVLAIREWYRAQFFAPRLRVVVLGNAGAGKSTLVRSAVLQCALPATPGMTADKGKGVSEWEMHLGDGTADGAALTLAFCAFAESVTPALQLQLLGEHTQLVVVCYDLCGGCGGRDVATWVSLTHARAPNAKLFVVGTHEDKIVASELASTVNSTMSAIKEPAVHFSTSATTSFVGVEILMKAVEYEARARVKAGGVCACQTMEELRLMAAVHAFRTGGVDPLEAARSFQPGDTFVGTMGRDDRYNRKLFIERVELVAFWKKRYHRVLLDEETDDTIDAQVSTHFGYRLGAN